MIKVFVPYRTVIGATQKEVNKKFKKHQASAKKHGINKKFLFRDNPYTGVFVVGYTTEVNS